MEFLSGFLPPNNLISHRLDLDHFLVLTGLVHALDLNHFLALDLDHATCFLYADIKVAVKQAASVFGMDESWFDIQSIQMSAPTITHRILCTWGDENPYRRPCCKVNRPANRVGKKTGFVCGSCKMKILFES